ncbi:MAG: serine hydrolase domain-containing protein, partial [Eubacteriales bacterium]|nr:serine hydrolase domain-containing protein [Eubacteriales bacterium]
MDFDFFESKLEEVRNEYGMGGIACAVTDCDKILFAKGFGVTSVEKPWDEVRPDTLFRIASNTKFTVALSLMRLFEDGLIDLDAPLSRYIPWFDLSRSITIRKIFSHTAGLPNEYTPDGPLDEDGFEASVRDELCNIKLVHNPEDEVFLYSNWGYRLAGIVLSRVTGMLPSEAVREFVLKPLKMEHSMFDIKEAITYQVAIPHSKGPVVNHYMPVNANRFSTGGLFSNVEDMTALARVILNEGAPLIKKETFDMMRTNYAKHIEGINKGYGFGIMEREYGGLLAYGHTGANPPYRSCIFAFPEKDIAVAFTLNTD